MNFTPYVLSILAINAAHDLYYWANRKTMYDAVITKRAQKIAENPALLKFKSLEQELILPELEVQGTIPAWLEGTLMRNGPAKFETSCQVTSHPFDGFAMLHAFTFNNGKVSYANKFIQSNYYKNAMATGKIEKGF